VDSRSVKSAGCLLRKGFPGCLKINQPIGTLLAPPRQGWEPAGHPPQGWQSRRIQHAACCMLYAHTECCMRMQHVACARMNTRGLSRPGQAGLPPGRGTDAPGDAHLRGAAESGGLWRCSGAQPRVQGGGPGGGPTLWIAHLRGEAESGAPKRRGRSPAPSLWEGKGVSPRSRRSSAPSEEVRPGGGRAERRGSLRRPCPPVGRGRPRAAKPRWSPAGA
jgi:hypothetical protein